MKKAIKGLIVASAVAAVVGVGAVSYAAWSASTDTSKNVTGATGQIKTVGAITVSPTEASGTLAAMNKLCPVDQTTGKPSDCVTYWEFDLSTSATGGQAVKYTIEGSLTEGTGTNKTGVGSAELRWSTTTPSATSGTALNAETAAADITGTKVYVYLVASNTDAMNAVVSVTFAAVEDTSGT